MGFFKKNNSRAGRLKKRLFGKTKIIVLIVLVLVFAAIAALANDMFALFKTDSSKVKIAVPPGATSSQIADMLAGQGVIDFPLSYFMFVRLSGDAGKENFGEFEFSKNMSYSEIVSILKSTSSLDSIWATIPEGYEAKQIVELFVSKDLGTKQGFMAAINEYDYDFDFVKAIPLGRQYRLEGYLMPDTYIFSKTEGEVSIINKMLNNFNKKINSKLHDKASELGMTPDQVIILASIIEREAGSDKERALVSSVFHNRLDNKNYPYLESCATVQYILGERKKVLSVADTKIVNPYNTYINAGLPPGPIASPGAESVNAALYPDKTEYYYFVAKKDGTSLFAKTFEEHNKNIAIANSQ